MEQAWLSSQEAVTGCDFWAARNGLTIADDVTLS
jgi:hypothetical protein